MKRKGILISIVICILACFVMLFIYKNKKEENDFNSLIKKIKEKTFVVEYGNTISDNLSDYIDTKDTNIKDVTFEVKVENENNKNYPAVGKYEATIKYKNKKEKFLIEVKDTTSPNFIKEVDEIKVDKGKPVEIESYFEIEDKSECTLYSNINTINSNVPGIYTLEIVAKDIYANRKKKEVKLIIKETIINKKLSLKLYKQEKSYYCSCACVQMVLDLFNINVSQEKLAEEMDTNEKVGTYDVKVAYVLNQYLFKKQPETIYDDGYRVESENIDNEQLFYDRIIDNIDHGYPTMLQFDMNTLYEDGRTVNHQAIIIGYEMDKDEIKTITIMDPYDDVAGEHTYSAKKIYKAMMASKEPAYIW